MMNSLFNEELDEQLLKSVVGGSYDPSGDVRLENELYYRKDIIDQSKTPKQLVSTYPELSGFLSTLTLFGFSNTPVSQIVAKFSLSSVQSMIDTYTP